MLRMLGIVLLFASFIVFAAMQLYQVISLALSIAGTMLLFLDAWRRS